VGQVYKATLKGKECVVKVQHPNLKNVMHKDFLLLEYIAGFTDEIFALTSKNSFRVKRWLSQFKIHMEDQLDFNLEAENLKIFNKNFKMWPHVWFPRPECSTETILVESFESGRSIYDYIAAAIANKAAAFGFKKMNSSIGEVKATGQRVKGGQMDS